MKILILGGISEAKQLALGLHEQGHFVIYSIAGIVRQPNLPCEIHTGGFSNENKDGILGLQQYCTEYDIELLIDATHPYAQTISEHAVAASHQLAGIPCWRYERPSWQESHFPNWNSFDNWAALWPQISRFRNVLFSIGLSAIQLAENRLPHQHWIIRSARSFEDQEGITQLNAIGPFSYEGEISLLQLYHIEAVVCKNSGSEQVVEKLRAANTLGIPLYVQQRPALPVVEQVFNDVNSIIGIVSIN